MSTAPDTSVSSAGAVDAERWFAEEVRPHESAVRGYLQNRFPSIDADDVLQESYLKLLRLPFTGRISSAKAYFFAIARNTASRVLRRSRLFSPVRVNELPDTCLVDVGQNGAELANAHQRHALVIAAIDRLPPRCREVLHLAVLQAKSPAEIARALRISENTVRVQMARGIKTCSHYLRTKGERT